jgi:hypothetical protein
VSEATGREDHGSASEVSGSAVSVSQGESPTREQRNAAPISAARTAKLLSGATETAN